MMEQEQDYLANVIKQRLAEHDELIQKFNNAQLSEHLKEDISLSIECSDVTEFRMDKTHFYIKKITSGEIMTLSVMTGPKSLKTQVEGWINRPRFP